MSTPAAPGEAAAVAAAVRAALRGADGLPAGTRAGAPMPVCTLGGTIDHWFVPLEAGERLVAFLRFTRAAELQGLSSFLRGPGRLQDAPAASDWLDAAVIRARVLPFAAAGESAGTPMLSFDAVPERLAWAVPLDSASGRRWAFVAGTSAWIAQVQD